jgi:MFS family permease
MMVDYCLANPCSDPGGGIISPGTGQPKPTPVPTLPPGKNEIDLPLFGRVNLAEHSLTFSTLVIAAVDGVNPCSIWVLTMLLALVVHTGSRKRIILIGLIFLTVTAGIYALFIAGIFTALSFVSYVKWIQVVVSLVALVMAVINIKDYFWYKEGVSLTISDKAKPGLYEKMRKVATSTGSIWALLGATIVLGAGVSLVEFACTSGFPVIWSNILAANKVSTPVFLLQLLLYLLVYQFDELVIFFIAVFTLKASKLDEKQGRILKLFSGVLMFALAIVMIVNPGLMNTFSSSIYIFAAAFGLALLVLLFHRQILPAFGIWIGTEKQTKRKPRRRN